ncbi:MULTISPECIES: alpha/beta hydrolase [Brucella/Ochrobactrum group]|uniref:alpha/beta hydrolase n=1 Tax=Brucella/Ochrobactrum group TaxID=2826938 RepID=UPI0015913D68|nr:MULTISPECIES: alpha/beta hydrolase [Brucella/Ochrobactrum group]MCH4540003.1 alpha/beta hydrolase [Ochrobactrum sp. A-1]
MVLRRVFSRTAPALLVLLSLLAGCASRPEGVLVPVGNAASPGTTKVDLVVATTRRPSDKPGILFSGERDKLVSLNEIVVSIPPEKNRKAGEVQWPKKLPPNPQKDFTTVSVTPLKTDVEMAGWVRPHLTKSRRVMVFVHGFNNTFEDSVYRFAQIVHDSGADVAPVIFTWPSRASVFDYNYDKESTNYSRDALEQILRAIAREPEVKDITVMAHSMGSWLTVEALRQMAIRDGRVNTKITDVILASPDLDVDVFSKQFLAMGKPHPRFTLFTSRDDKALALSRRISGNIDRLGQIDPSIEPYRSELEKAGITVIDLTKLKSGDRLNHGKFASSPEVVQLIGQRLVAGQTITDSQVGLGDRLGAVAIGTAQGVGTAASLVVTAPIAVFDPNTRKTYDEQIDRFGRAVGNTVGAVTIPTQ